MTTPNRPERADAPNPPQQTDGHEDRPLSHQDGPLSRDRPQSRQDQTLSILRTERPRLIDLAYRLLGSLADAEDVVQEAYVRWYAMSPQARQAIEVPGAWLSRVTSRICLDQLRSARMRRENYVGEWLPEPLPDRTEWTGGRPGGRSVEPADPADRVTLDESVNMAFLVVLDSMTPAERVAFILHDVFRYSFAEVGEIVGRTPAACRQLASSARRRMRASHSPAGPAAPAATASRRAALVRDFKQAWQAMDIEALIGLLDPGATALADGGGLAAAVPHPIEGSTEIVRYMSALAAKLSHQKVLERTVNGQPGLVIQEDGVTVSVLAFDFSGEKITRLWAVRNPEKLRTWTAG
ncbi:sigma-70 family RNA polymerase sigma factor [Streptomyces sp. p1417]|uniref:Sigma-70 family RNA polymerase sigma factor n=1 Tax=Streptomyces typhae TaxID=2681492 RepID=A0A6L6X2N6_9ACTN|nr:RNA polymerase sigma factor SigJ [Streptomyces typhae]MVO87889.1 sigma-70 family RNA polymerase sigma factor [Streptomyces typhae]